MSETKVKAEMPNDKDERRRAERGLDALRVNAGIGNEKCTALWYGEFHDKDGNSHKFYSVHIEGKCVTRRWGRCVGYGSHWKPDAIVKEHNTTAEAISAAKDLILTKKRKGYSTLYVEGFV